MKGISNNLRIPRKHRISKDLDGRNIFRMQKDYYNAHLFSSFIMVYETTHGFHIQLGVKNRTFEMDMHIRRILGDCSGRLELDEGRLDANEQELIETLFGWKEIYGEEMGEELINPLSEPFWNWRNHK